MMPVFLNATARGYGKGWRPSFADWWSLSLAKPRQRVSRARSVAPTRWTARRSCRPLGQKKGSGFEAPALCRYGMRKNDGSGRKPDFLASDDRQAEILQQVIERV